MKKIISLLLAASMLLGCMLVLSSCGGDSEGAQFKVYLGEPIYDFDPTDYYADANAEKVMSLLFEPLFTLNSRGKIKNAAAKSYKIDKNERKITITLRESEWSNGFRVLATDFVYSWRDVILDPDEANPAAPLLYDIEGALEVNLGQADSYDDLGLYADGYDKIVITYREGADPERLLKNLSSLATAPVCQSEHEKNPDSWSKAINTMVFNGPFSIRTINYDEGTFALQRNNGYHQLTADLTDFTGKVNPYIIFADFGGDSVYGEDGTIKLTYNDIEEKTIFFMGDASLAERKASAEKADVIDALSTYSYVFNTADTDSILSIPEVRKALSMAIDRDKIIEEIVFGIAATGFIPDAVDKNFRKNNTVLREDTEAARELISSVNFGTKRTSINLFINSDEESVAIANIVKAAWEDLDSRISVNIYTVSVKEKYIELEGETIVDFRDSAIQYILKEATEIVEDADGNVKAYGYYTFDVDGTSVVVDAFAVDWMMYTTDPFVGLASLSSIGGYGIHYAGNGDKLNRNNVASWNNDEYNALIKAAYEATDEETRTAKLKEAEALLIEQSPVVPLVFNQNFAFVSNKLKGVDDNRLGFFEFTDADLNEKYWFDPDAILPDEEEGEDEGESEE